MAVFLESLGSFYPILDINGQRFEQDCCSLNLFLVSQFAIPRPLTATFYPASRPKKWLCDGEMIILHTHKLYIFSWRVILEANTENHSKHNTVNIFWSDFETVKPASLFSHHHHGDLLLARRTTSAFLFVLSRFMISFNECLTNKASHYKTWSLSPFVIYLTVQPIKSVAVGEIDRMSRRYITL